MLVILKTLTSVSRDSQMHCLDVRFMVKSEVAYILLLHKLPKTWRKCKTPPKLYFYKYLKDQELCVVSALNKYLKRTKHGGKLEINFSYFKLHKTQCRTP